MQKICAFLLAGMLMLSVALPALADPLCFAAALAEPGPGDLSQEEALIIARTEWQKAVGAVDEAAEINGILDRYAVSTFITVPVEGKAERAWRMTLRDRLSSEDCAVTLLSPSGEVVEVETYHLSDRLEALHQKMGDMAFWSLEDFEKIGLMFERAPWDTSWHGLPGDGDMPQEEAIAKAREIVLERSNVTAETLDALTVSVAFWVNKPPVNDESAWNETNFWSISFGTGGPDSGEPFQLLYFMHLSSVNGEVYFYYDPDGKGAVNG